MLGIMAGMKQEDSYAAIVFALVVVFGSMCMAGFAGNDASHVVADMLVQKTADFPQFQYINMVVGIPVGTQRPFFHGPDYSADPRDSAVALVQGGRCPCCTGRRGDVQFLDMVVDMPGVVRLPGFVGRRLRVSPQLQLINKVFVVAWRRD